jgi:hypothetical protein
MLCHGPLSKVHDINKETKKSYGEALFTLDWTFCFCTNKAITDYLHKAQEEQSIR